MTGDQDGSNYSEGGVQQESGGDIPGEAWLGVGLGFVDRLTTGEDEKREDKRWHEQREKDEEDAGSQAGSLPKMPYPVPKDWERRKAKREEDERREDERREEKGEHREEEGREEEEERREKRGREGREERRKEGSRKEKDERRRGERHQEREERHKDDKADKREKRAGDGKHREAEDAQEHSGMLEVI